MNKEYQQISILWLQLLDKTITPQDLNELERLLCSTPAALDYSAELLMQFHLIRNECKQMLSCEAVPFPLADSFDRGLWEQLAKAEIEAPRANIEENRAPESVCFPPRADRQIIRKINKTSLFTAVLSLAAMLLVLAYLKFAPVSHSQLVGRLSREVDTRWADASGIIQEGCDLYTGPMKLTHGLAEITLDNGTKMIVQSPCEFELESVSQVCLSMGQLVVDVRKQADKHFVVRTPNAAIIDFGTEFGIRFDGRQTQTHVFEGEVEIRNSSDLLRYEKSIPLKEGQTGQVNDNGEISLRNIESAGFVRSEEFEIKLLGSKRSAYHRWLAYSYDLRRDADLVVYYTFQKDPTLPESIRNVSETTWSMFNCNLKDVSASQRPLWAVGRWPEMTALSFDHSQRQYLRIPSGPDMCINGPITLAAWVQCPGLSNGGHILSNRVSGGGPCNYQLGYRLVTENTPWQQLHIARKMKTEDWDNQIFSVKLQSHFPYSDWTLITVTHDNQTVRFYRNGELVDSQPWVHQQEVFPADLWIGTDGEPSLSSCFSGIIGELAVLKRVLSPDEIRQMYEAGKP